MSSRDPRFTLRQIRDFATRAQELCADSTFEQLKADWRQAAALERLLECVGEAAKRLPGELREQYPAVPWRKVTGMRDYICHGYDTLDYRILWDVVALHLPLLLATVEEMLTALADATPDDEQG
jgi:uncharacterized protein with HEPN domain